MSVADLAIVAALVFGWGALSARLERFDVTAPIAFVVAGLLLTHGPLAFLSDRPQRAGRGGPPSSHVVEGSGLLADGHVFIIPGGRNERAQEESVVTSGTQGDIEQMRDQVFFEGPERGRRLSRYWLLLLLSAVIATAGVVSDSTATVIGAMIIAPLMTPILGVVLGVVTADRANLGRCLLLLAAGAAAVVALSWLLGHLVPYPVVAATNSQVAARVTPRLVDLVAALATGAVGSVALTRPDVSDTLPGVAIAISLVPPLAVAGLTLQSGSPGQCLGALLLFATNVVAILASGIVVMALYRVGRLPGQATAPPFRRPVAVLLVVLLLGAVLVPLWINSDRVDKTTIRQAEVQAVAEHWAHDAGWSVIGVTATGDRVLVDATGPRPAPDLAVLRQGLDAAGLAGLDVQVSLTTVSYQPLPK